MAIADSNGEGPSAYMNDQGAGPSKSGGHDFGMTGTNMQSAVNSRVVENI